MDPTLKSRIISDLKATIPELAPQLRTAAKYIIDHPFDFGLDPIRDTARKAHVSTYTLVNMAKYMKFASFEEFRQPFRHALVSGAQAATHPTWINEIRESGDLGATFSDAAQNTLSIVSNSLGRQQIHELEAIIDMLLEANTVYLTAVRASHAMAYFFHYVGRMALPSLQLIPRHMNSPIDDLIDAKPGDVLVAITVTPYSRETMQACKYAQEKGLKLLFITDSEIVSTEITPEYSLVASVLSTHHFGAFTGMMAVIEMLIALLMERGGNAAKNRIKSYEELRNENNAYWVSQKKH